MHGKKPKKIILVVRFSYMQLASFQAQKKNPREITLSKNQSIT